MSEFELATIPLGFVLGLGVALILASVGSAIRERDEHTLHWLPLTWAGIILLFQVQYWFALYDLDAAIGQWGWLWYGQALCLAFLLFLAGSLVLPTTPGRVPGGLLADFERNGRLAPLLVILYAALWMIPNSRMGGSLLLRVNLLNAAMCMLAFPVYRRPSSVRTRSVATLAFLGVLAYTFIVEYSRPGPDPVP